MIVTLLSVRNHFFRALRNFLNVLCWNSLLNTSDKYAAVTRLTSVFNHNTNSLNCLFPFDAPSVDYLNNYHTDMISSEDICDRLEDLCPALSLLD